MLDLKTTMRAWYIGLISFVANPRMQVTSEQSDIHFLIVSGFLRCLRSFTFSRVWSFQNIVDDSDDIIYTGIPTGLL